jgi:hypothetical protein
MVTVRKQEMDRKEWFDFFSFFFFNLEGRRNRVQTGVGTEIWSLLLAGGQEHAVTLRFVLCSYFIFLKPDYTGVSFCLPAS